MFRKIRTLIVDDSAMVRESLSLLIASDPQIEVIGAAPDPYAAVRIMNETTPDVMILDVEMPRMDGLTFLDHVMAQHPIPIIICSTLTAKGSKMALTALDKGAVEVLCKPKLGTREFFEESRIRLCEAVKAAAAVDMQRRRPFHLRTPPPKLTADAVLPRANSMAMIQTTEKVVVVGASTGGTEALQEFLLALPADSPGVVIVQHMPAIFTAHFAQRLNEICAVTVLEATDGMSVVRGQALIAPGDMHMLLKRSGARYYVDVRTGPFVCRHRPSVDVLFRSAARYAGANAVGVIMTGMGDDGARGMLEMKEAGSFNIAQDEESCVVYGMPMEAVKLGAVNVSKPLSAIAEEVLRRSR